jgi:hypothetical protein
MRGMVVVKEENISVIEMLFNVWENSILQKLRISFFGE